MMKNEIVWIATAELRPHALHKQLYGPPTANPVYKEIKADMERRGFDERWPLLVTEDRRILWGATRWAAAKAAGRDQVPCTVFRPKSPDTAEAEYEEEILRGNVYRKKTELTLARELRKRMEVETKLAKARQGRQGDEDEGGPSKSVDRVGKIYKISGKSVVRRLKVLDAIEAAEKVRDGKKAERLTDLLERGKVVQALDLIRGKPAAARKAPKVEVPRTPADHSAAGYSEFFEAFSKAFSKAELDLAADNYARAGEALAWARNRMRAPAPAVGAARARWRWHLDQVVALVEAGRCEFGEMGSPVELTYLAGTLRALATRLEEKAGALDRPRDTDVQIDEA
jgi:hypothetical protein